MEKKKKKSKNLTEIENLALPMLQELYLHRNRIQSINGLHQCPNIKKLWLFQNLLTNCYGLQEITQLEDCWLQANQIQSLDGFVQCSLTHLSNLGLSGNPITSFEELGKLSELPRLREISFSDIHFGRCPIVDMNGYLEYLLLQCKSLNIIDGVNLSDSPYTVKQAEDAYYDQVIIIIIIIIIFIRYYIIYYYIIIS
jgi:Leucine-rich repeat (LRR) protein